MIPKLKAVIPIERAEMKVRVTISGKDTNKFRERILKLNPKVENEENDFPDLTMVSLFTDGRN